MGTDEPRLKLLFQNQHLDWLLQRLKTRAQQGQPLTGTIVLANPSAPEREAIDSLLGRKPSRARTLQVPLPVLEEILRRAGVCQTLEHAVQILTGPIQNQRAARLETDQTWTSLFVEFSEGKERRPEILEWIGHLRTKGILKRLGRNDPRRARSLLEDALRIIGQLPAPGLPLATLAARTTGDSHALDPGSPLSTLVLRAASLLGGTGAWNDAESRRDTWAGVGVLCDELSAPVLTLNLTAAGGSSLAQLLALQAAAGQPTYLTTRQLLQAPLNGIPRGTCVYVCENPAVVATAANELGPRSAPIVCIDGQPKTAARILLTQLRRGGAQIRYHGDFDWPGLRIAQLIQDRHQARPWRMGAEDYLHAPTGRRLEGEPFQAGWDHQLTREMIRNGHAVYEEQVLEHLIADLAGDSHDVSS